jgi:hypothetical protein
VIDHAGGVWARPVELAAVAADGGEVDVEVTPDADAAIRERASIARHAVGGPAAAGACPRV